MVLDAAKETTIRMNDDGIYPLSDNSTKHDDGFFQENNATTKGYKSKQIHESHYMTKQTSMKSLQDAHIFQDNNNNNSTTTTPPIVVVAPHPI